jgi:D-alanyl-D-alanine dipeptidase
MFVVISLSGGPSKKNPGMRGNYSTRFGLSLCFIIGFFLATLTPLLAQSSLSILPGAKPPDAPKELKQLVGIYSDESKKKQSYILLEDNGRLLWRNKKGENLPFGVLGDIAFPPSEKPIDSKGGVVGHSIVRNQAGLATDFCYLNFCYSRIDPGGNASHFYSVKPVRPVEELRKEALLAVPPVEKAAPRASDLVELSTLDNAIHLDIRYATSNDFLGVPVYTQARAFLQRPAAEALVRVLHKLQPLGYGLLIHDGYRPWYVTKIFWDATPPEGKIFVADPAKGSRHNRGCAVDLTLYDLKTGAPIEMTGYYDEMSPRSFPDYPGGTSLERWHRDLLRRAMESEGFTVFESEWWHFDYKDWPEYGILNIPFEKLNVKRN